jgi:hypothetical protein
MVSEQSVNVRIALTSATLVKYGTGELKDFSNQGLHAWEGEP